MRPPVCMLSSLALSCLMQQSAISFARNVDLEAIMLLIVCVIACLYSQAPQNSPSVSICDEHTNRYSYRLHNFEVLSDSIWCFVSCMLEACKTAFPVEIL